MNPSCYCGKSSGHLDNCTHLLCGTTHLPWGPRPTPPDEKWRANSTDDELLNQMHDSMKLRLNPIYCPDEKGERPHYCCVPRLDIHIGCGHYAEETKSIVNPMK